MFSFFNKDSFGASSILPKCLCALYLCLTCGQHENDGGYYANAYEVGQKPSYCSSKYTDSGAQVEPLTIASVAVAIDGVVTKTLILFLLPAKIEPALVAEAIVIFIENDNFFHGGKLS